MARTTIINAVLLEAISGRAKDLPRARVPQSARDWAKLAVVARQHRLEPALHNFVLTNNEPGAIPDSLRRQWSEAFRTATVRSLRNQERLIRINAILCAAEIPYAALKGSWLAYHAYPHPALRPMRDLDILVPAGRALETFEALLAAGFERMQQYDTPLEFAAAAQKHLPPIRCPVMDVVVEVHNCIFMPDAGPEHLPAEVQTDRLLERRVWYPIGDVPIPFLSGTDTLLHLILHSAFDHVFNNGPLVIGDVAFLLARATIDWDAFWARASAGGWMRGCALMLHIAGRYHQIPPISWPDRKALIPPDDIVTAALDLMFQDDSVRAKIALVAEMQAPRSVPAWFTLLWSRIVPPAHVLAAYAGVPRSGRNIWWLYPSWLASKLSELARTVLVSAHRHDAMRTRTVKQWQQGE
jgi:hypothetical protein